MARTGSLHRGATMKRIGVAVSLIASLGVAQPRVGADKPAEVPREEALEPWASSRRPTDTTKRHLVEITTARQEYRVTHGGTMDGTNCRSPIGGSFGVWDQSWESNRAVRMANVGETDVSNPWLSN